MKRRFNRVEEAHFEHFSLLLPVQKANVQAFLSPADRACLSLASRASLQEPRPRLASHIQDTTTASLLPPPQSWITRHADRASFAFCIARHGSDAQFEWWVRSAWVHCYHDHARHTAMMGTIFAGHWERAHRLAAPCVEDMEAVDEEGLDDNEEWWRTDCLALDDWDTGGLPTLPALCRMNPATCEPYRAL